MIDIKWIVDKVQPVTRFIITDNLELVIDRKHNIFFRLEDIQTERDFNRKIVSWLSRPSCKGLPVKAQKRIRGIFNALLGTSFNHDEMMSIYTYFGCDCHTSWAYKFVDRNYDLGVIDEMLRNNGEHS